MNDAQRRMYELEYPSPAIRDDYAKEQDTTMVVALKGYADAGLAVESSADHLQAALENHPLASFNNDELIDYRSRRPAVTLDGAAPVEIEELELSIKVLRDLRGKPFLLLSGPEPDLRWEAFTTAVADLVDKYDVDNVIFLYAAPMPVPHTRPLIVTAHGNSHELVSRMIKMDAKMMVPGSATMFIEKELTKRGRNVAGYTAHVPHYLAASAYPKATLSLLDAVAQSADLQLPLQALEYDMANVDAQLGQQLSDSDEVATVVHGLERQFDDAWDRYRLEHPQAIMPGEEHAPTGDELSAEFEKFLASLDENPGTPGTETGGNGPDIT